MESTQKYIDISEIKRDCLVLNDGTLRAVILVSSINFGLKSQEEQTAVIQAYVQFLNSLEHPIQIVVQSRKLNIQPHIEDLREKMRNQTNELLKSQMADYIDFLQELVKLGQIMTKKFYIVVPYNPAGDKRRGFLARLSEVLSAGVSIRLKRERFERYREALFRRVDNVISALSSMGLKAVPLDTQSLIELFYNSYNPIESETEKLAKLDKLRIEQ
ncbi:hypothetical protein J7K86_01845 [bacterium]|nr:hypothetical protein [bacterium]